MEQTEASFLYCVGVFIALGVQHVFYAFVYNYPQTFRRILKDNNFTREKEWVYFERIFFVLKVLQYGVVFNDLFLVRHGQYEFSIRFLVGMSMVVLGQTLNFATFAALGRQGVYYGQQLGYRMDRVTTFPFNLYISDPQYWGVLITVFGVYFAFQASSYVLPCIEFGWYLLTMLVFENERGGRWLALCSLQPQKCVE